MLNENIEFSYSNFIKLDKNDKACKIILTPKFIDYNSLLFNNYIKTVTAIYDTKRIGKVYMPEYRKRQDWGLWFNILNKTNKFDIKSIFSMKYQTSYDVELLISNF